MKSTELRIGNLVSFGGRMATVYQVNRSGAVLQYDGDTNTEIEGVRRSTVSINDIEPVTLTKDWLISSGFYKNPGIITEYILIVDSEYTEMKRFTVLQSEEKIFYFIPSIRVAWSVRLDFIHQLQNLYFSITKQELSV